MHHNGQNVTQRASTFRTPSPSAIPATPSSTGPASSLSGKDPGLLRALRCAKGDYSGDMSESGDSMRSIGHDLVASIKRTFIPVLLPLALMWLMLILSLLLGNWFNRTLSLEARNLSGLIGILFMPLLHGGIWHLIGNTMSWLVLGGMTSLLTRRFTLVMVLLWVLSGVILWVIGTPWVCHAPQGSGCVVHHVGASAVIYGFAGFIVTYGFLVRRIIPILFALFVAVVYGLTMLVGMLPFTPGVSWTGHLAGGIAGVLVALFLLRDIRAERRSAAVSSPPI